MLFLRGNGCLLNEYSYLDIEGLMGEPEQKESD